MSTKTPWEGGWCNLLWHKALDAKVPKLLHVNTHYAKFVCVGYTYLTVCQLEMLKARLKCAQMFRCYLLRIDAYYMLYRYIPVLMAQAKIYWELEMYQQVSTYVCAESSQRDF